MDPREKWDQRYRTTPTARVDAAPVLQRYRHLLPGQGKALDLACGRGGNALLLAGLGLETWAWDISAVAIGALREQAPANLHAETRDVVAEPPPADSFDVIVVSRFLDRGLCPAIAQALRPGGLLYYQTFVREGVSKNGPANPAFRLAPNELLTLLPDLRVLAFHDEGRTGDTGQGIRDESWLVARRDSTPSANRGE